MARNKDSVEVEVNYGCIKQTDRSLMTHHTISGNIKKMVQRLQSAHFVTKPSVVVVLPEQQHTF